LPGVQAGYYKFENGNGVAMMNQAYVSSFSTMMAILAGLILLPGCDADQNVGSTLSPDDSAESVFIYDKAEISGVKPWTSENFANDPGSFQFAIIGDRTGGANPKGTFEKAIEQLNWLRPEFVMSVGDYIEGYTAKPEVLRDQWDEFDSIVAKLQMPFFFVRGNHDINTPITRPEWTKRRGPDYYYFKYQNVLFIALDTESAEESVAPELEADLATYNDLNLEDPEAAKTFAAEVDLLPRVQEIVAGKPPQIEFSEQQVAWFKRVLEENKDVRWTLIFMHQPVWNNPSESFKEIDVAIQGRNYTFFGGHTHYYDYDPINGQEYITVASAGATIVADGPGNVDMLTWVTMTDEGPEIAGIALKGVFDRKGLDPTMFDAYDRTPDPDGIKH
jgi:predicted phosphodiesterase